MNPPAIAGWLEALRRGFVAFLVVAGIGQLFALVGPALAGTRASLGSFVRLGLVYLGSFHHVAVELDVPELDVTAAPGSGATSLSIGIALLSVTAVAGWLLFRGGRAAAERGGGGTGARVLLGAAVAPGYAIPAFALMALARTTTSLRWGAVASGELRVGLSTWQAVVFPFAIAAAAGAAGGLSSAVRGPLVGAAAAGGWRMFVLVMSLSLLGLFAAGIVQPDGPAALLTPSTARYLRPVLDHPGLGVAAVGHHVAVAPNEALWTIAPAMGGCLVARGTGDADLLCYGRFPREVATVPIPISGEHVVLLPLGEASFGPAPRGYLLFLLVPLVSAGFGGRRAGERSGEKGRRAVLAGTAAGLVFAGLVGAASLLSTVTIGYGAAFGAEGTSGWLIAGPDVPSATFLALVWGAAGGALGAASLRWRSPRSSPPAARTTRR